MYLAEHAHVRPVCLAINAGNLFAANAVSAGEKRLSSRGEGGGHVHVCSRRSRLFEAVPDLPICIQVDELCSQVLLRALFCRERRHHSKVVRTHVVRASLCAREKFEPAASKPYTKPERLM